MFIYINIYIYIIYKYYNSYNLVPLLKWTLKFFWYLFLAALGFEHKTSHLLGGCSYGWSLSPNPELLIWSWDLQKSCKDSKSPIYLSSSFPNITISCNQGTFVETKTLTYLTHLIYNICIYITKFHIVLCPRIPHDI
jgi:hypothetical protein